MASSPPVTAPNTLPIDAHNPLPEASWLWRRIFTFVVTGVILWMVWGAITRLGATAVLDPGVGIPALLSLCKNLILVVEIMVTYYMVAPSAEQIARMMQTTGLLKSGVQFASRSLTKDEPGGGTSTATSASASLAPAPVVPVPVAEPVTPAADATADELPEYAR